MVKKRVTYIVQSFWHIKIFSHILYFVQIRVMILT